MKITVQVTQEHIYSALRMRERHIYRWLWSQGCPVALALRDALQHTFPPDAIFTVGNSIWMVMVEDKEEQAGLLPEEAQHFIDDIDVGKEVKPFSFQIEVHA